MDKLYMLAPYILVLLKLYMQIRYIISTALIPSKFIVLLWPNKNYADIKLDVTETGVMETMF
jgi:hypothetical protein